MTIIIKRYPNRKLYDTASRCYVTLEGIARLIRQGNPVQIIDHVTEEDLTNVILMQIIMGQEKKRSGLLPSLILMGIIQGGEDFWNEFGIPSCDELEKLKSQLDLLDQKITLLQQKKTWNP